MIGNNPAVIFDLDGTLIDSMKDFHSLVIDNLERRGITLTKDNLKRVGLELITDYQTIASKQGITLILKLFRNIGRKAGLSNIKSIGFTFECAKQAKKVYLSASLFPDVKQSLIQLKKAGFQLGVCTMASRKQMINSLTKHDIIHFFNPKGLISRDDVNQLKPNPEGILLALRMCSSNPSNGIYIGDLPMDILAGINAKTTTIGLTTGLVNKKIFLQFSQPTMVFDSLEQATSWILEKKVICTTNL